MAGKWRKSDLPDLEESPEAHWMRTVMGHEGPQWCTVRLRKDLAGRFAKAFARQFDTPNEQPADSPADDGPADPVDGLVASGAQIAQSTLSGLRRFGGDDSDATFDTDVLVDRNTLNILDQLLSGGDAEIVEIGPPSKDGPQLDQIRSAERSSSAILPADDGDEDRGDDHGDDVIVAIIDDGIGFANRRFRLSESKSRVEYFLDMNQTSLCTGQGRGEADGRPARGTVDAIGTTWTRQDIEHYLGLYPKDEDAIYRAMGMLRTAPDRRQPLKFQHSHGTHVLDLAAGYDFNVDDERDVARKRPIIAVQLPSEIVVDRSDSQMPGALQAALQWIEEAASELSERAIAEGRKSYLPIVLNFSFGVYAGPHDGWGRVEQRISQFVQRYRRRPGAPQCEVVLPAGNGMQARAVARLLAGKKGRADEIGWRVKPDDKTATFMQIWLPARSDPPGKNGEVAVSVVPPRGGPKKPGLSKLGRALDWEIDGQTYVRIYHQSVPRGDGQWRERITIAMRPTETDSAYGPKCPAGLWTVRVVNKGLSKGEPIDLRIQRDDPIPYAKPKGRQSYFDDPLYERFEPESGRTQNDERKDAGPVLRSRTLNAYGTGDDTVVVGGYRYSDGRPTRYSGAGPTTSRRVGPNLAAVCERSPSHPGVRAAGTHTGSTANMNGTSVAAPMVTRALADAFAERRTLQEVLLEIQCAEKHGIEGPNGSYGPSRAARHGVGRLQPSPPPHAPGRFDL